MSLIDTSYFVGELNIPLDTRGAVEASLVLFISKYEPLLLQKVLGYELYKSYTAGILANQDQKWVDLRDGKEYTNHRGRTVKWIGFNDSTAKKSFIANYVYYWFIRDNASQTTAAGEMLPKSENSTVISPATKMSRAWNEMVETIEGLIGFLDANKAVYADWHPADAHWIRREFRRINAHGI